jgi:hypothetical protein
MAAAAVEEFAEGLESEVADTCMSEMLGKAGSQAEGLSVAAYVDLVQLRNGDQTAEVTTTDLQTPLDPELRDELVAAVAERMAD